MVVCTAVQTEPLALAPGAFLGCEPFALSDLVDLHWDRSVVVLRWRRGLQVRIGCARVVRAVAVAVAVADLLGLAAEGGKVEDREGSLSAAVDPSTFSNDELSRMC